MANAIEARGLRKRFGKTTALDALDLTVKAGEVHAFLGPNGSGKTTTIRVLLGLLRKDGGEASLLGGDPWRDAPTLHARLAYVPGDVTLWPGLTGGEIIDLLGSLRGSRSGVDPKRRQALIERFALDPAKKARAYSKGNRRQPGQRRTARCTRTGGLPPPAPRARRPHLRALAYRILKIQYIVKVV